MQPLPRPDILDSLIKVVYPNYFNFKTRTRRSEFWAFYIIYLIVIVALFLPGIIFCVIYIDETNNKLTVDFPTGLFVFFVIGFILSILLLIPNIAIRVRRLHDVGKSGYWFFLYFTGIGAIYLLILFLSDSQSESNEYGPSPKYVVMLNPQDKIESDS